MDSDNLDNVSMHNKLSVHKMNYKEGEFFADETFALIIIVPITDKAWTWTEDGKYYHAEDHTNNDKDSYGEITKEKFDEYMAAGRQKIYNYLMEGINHCDNFLSAEPAGTYKTYKNSFKRDMNGTYKMITETTYVETDSAGTETEKNAKYTFSMKKNLPTQFTTKNDGSESYYKYSYGNAKFTKPADPTATTEE